MSIGTEAKRFNSISLQELLDSDIPPPRWHFPDIIPEEGIVVIGGSPGKFKTFFAMIITTCCVLQQSILSRIPSKKLRVLYIDEENGLRILKDRVQKILPEKFNPDNVQLKFMSLNGIKLDNAIDREALDQELTEFKPELVVIDSLVRTFNGKENDSDDIKVIFNTISRLSKKHHNTWLLIHHTRKSSGKQTKEDLRGSSDFIGAPDLILMINRISPDVYQISQEKNRYEKEIPSFRFKVLEDNNNLLSIQLTGNFSESTPYIRDECVSFIEQWIHNQRITSFTTKMVKEVCKERFKSNTLATSLNSLLDKRTVKKVGKGKWEVIKEV